MPRAVDAQGRRLIRDDGSRSARIVVVGEAGGRHEDRQGRPFVGPAGKLLTRWLAQAGLARSDCFLTNVLNFKPPGNDLGQVSEEDINAGVERVQSNIAAMAEPALVVPVGNLALRAVLNMQGITKRRGSIYGFNDRAGRTLKAIPTIHPAATFREGSAQKTSEGLKGRRTWKLRCMADWRRIAAESKFRELNLPKREHYIRPTLDDVQWLLAQIESAQDGEALALDIETPRRRIEEVVGHTQRGTPKIKRSWGDRYVSCIGFSVDPTWSMTIPTTTQFWGSERRLKEVLDLLRKILALPIPKATQNGLFDFWHLARPPFEVRPVRWLWDTLAMHHVEDPIEEHSLAFQASIFCRTQYWKDDDDEVKDWDESQRYNGKDCTHTRELVDVHRAIHTERALGSLYDRHYRSLLLPLLDCMGRGLPVDDARRRRRLAHLAARCITLRGQLATLAGEDLYGKTDLSNPKLTRFLYETLGLPKKLKKDKKTGLKKTTVNEVAVRQLVLEYPEQFGEAGSCILDVRRASKMEEFYDAQILDRDGKSRCMYGWAETLRLKSRPAPNGTGRNHQNFDRECREHLIPDPGCLAGKFDMSQAESRVVFAETGNAELIRLARLPPWEHDQHTATALRIDAHLRLTPGATPRRLGKLINHAAQRGMSGKTGADNILKETGLVYLPKEVDSFLEAYFLPPYDAIKGDLFRRVRHLIINEKKLTDPCGFTIHFEEERLSDDLFRRGYSFWPQHRVACHLNTHGHIPMYHFLRGRRSRVLVNEHDALWMSLDPGEAWDVWRFARESLEGVPIVCTNGVEFVNPVGCELGLNFQFREADAVEFKRPPTEEEFQDAVARLVGRMAA